MLEEKLTQEEVNIIVNEAVEIESEFIKDTIHLADNVTKLVVSVEFKDLVVRQIVESGGTLQNLEMIRPSLEDIFYHTGSRS